MNRTALAGHKMSWYVIGGAPPLYGVACICGWFKATYADIPAATYGRHLTDPTWGHGNPAAPPSLSTRFDSQGRPAPVSIDTALTGRKPEEA